MAHCPELSKIKPPGARFVVVYFEIDKTYGIASVDWAYWDAKKKVWVCYFPRVAREAEKLRRDHAESFQSIGEARSLDCEPYELVREPRYHDFAVGELPFRVLSTKLTLLNSRSTECICSVRLNY
jgi:hypothetical protein